MSNLCLPMGCLKFFATIAGFINIVIGIIFVIIGIVISQIDKNLIPEQTLKDVQTYIYLGFCIFGVLVILSGFFVIFGAWKKIKTLMLCYTIVTAIFFLIFVLIAVAGSVGNGMVKEYFDPQCNEIEFFKKPEQLFENAKEIFCKSCPCKIQTEVLKQWNESQIQEMTRIDAEQGAIKVTQCSEQSYKTQKGLNSEDFESLDEILSAIENYFECSGVCTGHFLYMFTDVNKGIPKNYKENGGCAQQFIDLANYFIETGLVVGAIGATLFIVLILLTCCLICHPNKKDYFADKKGEGSSSDYQLNNTTRSNY